MESKFLLEEDRHFVTLLSLVLFLILWNKPRTFCTSDFKQLPGLRCSVVTFWGGRESHTLREEIAETPQS